MGSSNTIKVIAGALVVLAIFLAVVAFKMSRDFAQSSQAKQATEVASTSQKTLAVVATKPLLANQPISKDSIALVAVEVAPKDYFPNVDDVVGQTPQVDIDAGSPLTPRFFAETNPLVHLIPAGTRALAFELNDVLGVGNFVKSGDVVDVLVYFKVDPNNQVLPAQARILLKDALVLAYDDRITAAPQEAKNADPAATAQSRSANPQQQNGKHQRTVILAVPEPALTSVMLGAGLGELRLALHGAPSSDNGASGVPVTSTVATASPPHYVRSDADALAVSSQAVSAASFWGANDQYVQGKPNVERAPTQASVGTKSSKPRENGIVIYRGAKHETVFP